MPVEIDDTLPPAVVDESTASIAARSSGDNIIGDDADDGELGESETSDCNGYEYAPNNDDATDGTIWNGNGGNDDDNKGVLKTAAAA
jgi:hypothetical protein